MILAKSKISLPNLIKCTFKCNNYLVYNFEKQTINEKYKSAGGR